MRAPLQVRSLTPRLPAPWGELTLVQETGSTNADLADSARRGRAGPWSVLVAEHQAAGRGRLGRTWTSAAGATLTFSALVPTPASPGWVPLLAGLAVTGAIEELYALRPSLKWPNDLLAPVGHHHQGRKLAGILCELTPSGVVVGIGLNLDQREDELPVPTATSLRLLAGEHPEGTTRELLLLAVLRHLAATMDTWAAAPDQVRQAYRSRCSTMGRVVRVELPGQGERTGQSLRVDDDGHLVVDFDGSVAVLASGDVTHVR